MLYASTCGQNGGKNLQIQEILAYRGTILA
jgi:hypothetical protein